MKSDASETNEHGFVSASVSDPSNREVVVIGDDDIATIMQQYASDAGHDVTPARDVAAYVDSAATDGASELVIRSVSRSMLDDGELVLEEQLERNNVPILAISGPTLTESQIDHTKANIVGWLTKPFGRAEFVQQVEDSIQRMVDRGRAGILPDSKPSGSDDPAPAGTKSGPAAGSNGHDPHATTADMTAPAVQTSSTQDELDDVASAIESASDETPVRTDELEAAFDRINELETKQEATTEELEGINDQLSELSKALTTVSDQLGALDDRLDDVDGRADAVEADVAENQQTIGSLSEGLDALADEQLRLTDKFEGTAREQAELRSTVDALVEWQDDVSVAFTALQSSE